MVWTKCFFADVTKKDPVLLFYLPAMHLIQGDTPFLFLVGLILAAGGGFSKAADDLPVIPARDVFGVQGRPAFCIEPAAAANGLRPWVWYAPTLGSTLPGEKETWMFRRLLASGVAIAGIDVGESYGSPAGQAFYQSLYRLVTKERGFSKRPVLLARSRGGLMHYGWASRHPTCVAGIAGIYPVCNLASYPGLDRAAPAYGLTPAKLSRQLANFNPIDCLAGLAAAGVPLLHLHGDCDKVVPLEENSGRLTKRYRELSGTIALMVVPGGGHTGDSRWFESEQLTSFMIEQAHAGAAGQTTLPPKEIVTITGRLRDGQVAIGGETAGWVLEEITGSDLKRIEVDMHGITKPKRFVGKIVQVTGHLLKRIYTERGEVLVLGATAIRE